MAWRRCPVPTHPPLLGSYLTSYTVWAELPEAQGRLDSSQQSHHVQVFDPAPAEATSCISSVVADQRGQWFEEGLGGFVFVVCVVGKSFYFPALLLGKTTVPRGKVADKGGMGRVGSTTREGQGGKRESCVPKPPDGLCQPWNVLASLHPPLRSQDLNTRQC